MRPRGGPNCAMNTVEQQLVRLLSLVVLLHAVAPSVLRAQAKEWTRCYDLELNPWDRAVRGSDTLHYAPPPRIYQDTARTAYPWNWNPGGKAVEPARGSPPSVHRYAVWEQFHADSVAVTWSTGFTGLLGRRLDSPTTNDEKEGAHDVTGSSPKVGHFNR